MAFFVGHLVDVRIGHLVALQHRPQFLGRAGPHGVTVRVVALPADVVDTDLVAEL
jgi:hypothetical protein